MTFVESVQTCFKKYADFKGTASLPEFWWFFLFTFVAGLAIGMVSSLLSMIFSFATLIPSFAVGARRLHDTGRSGWLQLLLIVPVIGWILLIYWLVQEGKPENREQVASEA